MDQRLQRFLQHSLELWRVDGAVDCGEAPVVAAITAGDGARITLETAPPGVPFRWIVRSEAAADGTANPPAQHRRPCASLTGALKAIRAALGIPMGSPLRVAAGGSEHDERARGQNAAALRGEGEVPGGPQSQTSETTIPVSVITGFLGSGKTTLLGRLLRDPAMARTAVIVNEFGEIGLDHDLIATSDESFVQLSNGCLCCRMRSDLMLTLGDLAARRAAGTVPRFERVVIETTGLADPAPVLHALMTERDLCGVYALDGVITTVDALAGLATLERHRESVKQVAVADRIVLTKTDVPGNEADALAPRLAAINSHAPLIGAGRGEIAPALLFGSGFSAGANSAFPDGVTAHAGAHAAHRHRDDISTFSIVRDEPLGAVTLALFLAALSENCGPDLLRMKGIVHIAEEPGRPAVVHGVQHVYHAPVWLERWPSADRRTRMVFIGCNFSEAWTRGLLELIEIEVQEETHARASQRRSAPWMRRAAATKT